jgi:hypothetical protein
MGEREKTSKRVASEVGKIQRKTALAMAKRAARSELKRIFDQELRQRVSEQQHSLSRLATASHSNS